MGEGVRPLSQNPFGFLSLTYGREKEDKPKIWDFGFWDSLFGFREGSNIMHRGIAGRSKIFDPSFQACASRAAGRLAVPTSHCPIAIIS